MPKKKKKDNKNYSTISISEDNKKGLNKIKDDLKDHHKKNIRIDKVISHLLIIHNGLKEPEKYYHLI